MEIGIINLPDGEYDTVWSGYKMTINGVVYETEVGVKCIHCEKRIKIVNKKVFLL